MVARQHALTVQELYFAAPDCQIQTSHIHLIIYLILRLLCQILYKLNGLSFDMTNLFWRAACHSSKMRTRPKYMVLRGTESPSPSYSYIKVPISYLGILRIHNLWILLRQNVTCCRSKILSSWTFSQSKLLPEVTS